MAPSGAIWAPVAPPGVISEGAMRKNFLTGHCSESIVDEIFDDDSDHTIQRMTNQRTKKSKKLKFTILFALITEG